MKKIKLKKYILMTGIVFFSFALWCFWRDGVDVSIRNNSGISVQNLKVGYVGGSLSSDVVNHQQTISFRFNPISDSDLWIQFEDTEGNLRKSTIEVYIEPDDEGMIEITIEPGNGLSINDCSSRPLGCFFTPLSSLFGMNCYQASTTES